MRRADRRESAAETGGGRVKTACCAAAVLLSLLAVYPGSATAALLPLPNEGWRQLLSENVHNGRVDYDRIKKQPKFLVQSLKEFEKVSRQEYGKWTRARKIAFWINAYNLFTIKAIIDHYPPRGWNLLYPKVSIRQIGGVWNQTVYRTAGQVVSLNQIEHKILRVTLKEPRIHFALVCASLGCPPLPPEPYDEETLEQRLDLQVYQYLSDPEHGLRWEPEPRVLYISEIFSWFGDDFDYYYRTHKMFPDLTLEKRNAMNFIWNYLPDEVQQQIKEGAFRIRYLDYDWSLNDLSQ
jgi:hypothetical protein